MEVQAPSNFNIKEARMKDTLKVMKTVMKIVVKTEDLIVVINRVQLETKSSTYYPKFLGNHLTCLVSISMTVHMGGSQTVILLLLS